MSEVSGQPVAGNADVPSLQGGIAEEDGFVPHCPHCDYILIGLTVERCPECGRRFSLAQLRQMHLRRKPTPWEDPGNHDTMVARYLDTCRAMWRPPFFLFLARPNHAGPAMRFALLTCLLTALLWAVILAAVALLLGSSARSPSIDVFWVVDIVASVPIAHAVLVTAWALFLLLRGPTEGIPKYRVVVIQVLSYLSCWLMAGLAVLAFGVLAGVLLDMARSLLMPAPFIVVLIGVAEAMLVAVWCCQADAAMRDGLNFKSTSLGPLFVLIAVPVVLVFGGLLAYALTIGLSSLL